MSTLQTATAEPLSSDLLFASRVVQYTQSDPTTGMTFRPGFLWPARASIAAGERPQICVAAVPDYSHGSEDEYLSDWDESEPFRSQGARLIFKASVDILDKDGAHVHLGSFRSTIQKRFVS